MNFKVNRKHNFLLLIAYSCPVHNDFAQGK